MNELAQHQNQAVASAVISATDRFSLTLSLAILVHALFILGITFTDEDRSKSQYHTMEVMLVQQRSKAPDTADYLAQVNLQGGDSVAEDLQLETLLPTPFPSARPEFVMPPTQKEVRVKTAHTVPRTTPQAATGKTMATAKRVTQKRPTKKKEAIDIYKNKIPVKLHATSTAGLLNNSFKIAALNARIRHKIEKRAKRPRRKFISANVKEYSYAAYEEAWRTKIERTGNLNYPEAARKQNLSGNLVLDVAVNADGSVHDIIIRRSSGKKRLDAAAIKIVKLAAPFSPFPEHIRKEIDILHITRTWQFTGKHSLR